MFFLLFPLFGLWWWLLTIGFFGWIIFCEEREEPLYALWVLLFYCVLISVLGDFGQVLKWITHLNFLTVLSYVISYIIVGFCWGIFRYWWEQHLSLAKYQDMKVEFLRSKGFNTAMESSEIPETYLDDWIRKTSSGPLYGFMSLRIFFQDQKKRIIVWMSWWATFCSLLFTTRLRSPFLYNSSKQDQKNF